MKGLRTLLLNILALSFIVVAAYGTVWAKGIPYAGDRGAVVIIAEPKSGIGPLTVQLEAVINVDGPVKLMWWFGDGTESTEVIPPPHYYQTGRYAVVLEVTDGAGKRYTASITIDSMAPIGGGQCLLLEGEGK